MLFNSWPFIYLLLATLFLYHVVLRGNRLGRHSLLLGASYVFYGWWDWRFLSLILFSTLVDYIVSLRIDAIRSRGGTKEQTRPWLIVSIISNLTLLGFFKYFNFFADSVVRLLDLMGLEAGPVTLYVVLPVGISFYTFQSMAYTIDVYRGTVPVTRNFITFALYVSFFPQLVAGPIERAQHLIPQFNDPKPLDASRVQSGIVLIILGFFKKMAIADPLFPVVHEVLDNPGEFSGIRLLMTVYLFVIHVYADFSGYSDIARGSARLFGIDLIRNFEQPFLSPTLGEYWRRWHISLMSWFRDYLYIPLGGSRVSPHRVYFNIVFVMGISGLWHGASWNWVGWGLLTGVFLCMERYAALRREALGIVPKPLTPLERFLRTLWVFHAFCVGAVVFLNPELANFLAFVDGLFTRWGPWSAREFTVFGILCAYMAVTLFIDIMQRRTKHHEFPLVMRPVVGGIVIGIMVVAIIFWSVTKGEPYFYFQF